MKKILLITLVVIVINSFAQYPRNKSTWKVWKTITIGEKHSLSEFRNSFDQKNVRYDSFIRKFPDELKTFSFSTDRQKVELIRVSTRDLYLPDTASYETICKVALASGLALCTGEDAFALREQYLDQPQDEALIIASPSIFPYDGLCWVFELAGTGGGVWLSGMGFDPKSQEKFENQLPNYYFIFRKVI